MSTDTDIKVGTYATMAGGHIQDQVLQKSLSDPEGFWGAQAQNVHWHKKPDRALKRYTKKLKSGTEHDHWSWFPGGKISTTYNCVDRHVINGREPYFFPNLSTLRLQLGS